MKNKIDYNELYKFIKSLQPVCHIEDIYHEYHDLGYLKAWRALQRLIKDGLVVKNNKLISVVNKDV